MSLLEKASIITTPTAYGVGVLNSIKPAIPFGEELLVNGNFASDSDWIKGQGWSIANGRATLTTHATSSSLNSTAMAVTSGHTYKIEVDVVTTSSGFRLYDTIGVVAYGLNVGKNIFYRTVSGSSYAVIPLGLAGATGSIQNISVKEVTDADFQFSRTSSATRVNPDYLIETVSINSANLVQNGNFSELGSELVTNGDFETDSDWNKTQATISNGVANISSDGSYAAIDQSNVSVIGKTYLYSIDVKSITGTMQFRLGSGTDVDITTTGVKTGYIVATSTTLEIKRKAGAGAINVTIDNVSVKQVDPNDNWTLGTG